MSTRKRVSRACKPCNQKKTKCDGGIPRCSTCEHRDLECSYGESKRRGPSIGSRKQYSGLDVSLQNNSNATSVEAATVSIANNDVDSTSNKHFRSVSTIPPDISKRLFQSFFDCIHPMWPVLYKPLYTSLDYTYPSPRIPAPLVLAIFAIASCVDNTQSSIHPQDGDGDKGETPEPRVFLEEALNMLQQGTGSYNLRRSINTFDPSISNCQTLVILALQQHGVAEYAHAATLVGLAAAMAIELRLHRFCEAKDSVESEIRSRLWWNLYILEKMMSGEMGRPVILRIEETDCAWPSVNESDEFELMSPQLQGQLGKSAIKMRTISAFHTTISLSIIFERIDREIYGIAARKKIRDDQAAGEILRMQLWAELQDWENSLETSSLRLDLSEQLTSVPPIVTNHVCVWTATIIVHRPFIERWRPGLSAEPTTDPYDICLKAANKICVVLEKYLEHLPRGPCDMIWCIFIAASILLHHSKQVEGDAAADTRRKLKQCIHWLSILGKSWKLAGARQQLLNDLYDLPQALHEPKSAVSPSIPHMNIGQPLAQPASLGNLLNPIPAQGIPLQPQTVEDDWSFLRDFGDSTDQFYSWDVELRDLLDGGFTFEGRGNA